MRKNIILLLMVLLIVGGCSNINQDLTNPKEINIDNVKVNLVKTFLNGNSYFINKHINSNIGIIDLTFKNQTNQNFSKTGFINYLKDDMLKVYNSFEFVDYSTAINDDTATLTGSIVANIDQEYTFYIALDLVKGEENWLINQFNFANSEKELNDFKNNTDEDNTDDNNTNKDNINQIITNWANAIKEGNSYTKDIASNIEVVDIATLEGTLNQELSTAEYEVYLNNHYLKRKYKSFSIDDRIIEVDNKKATVTATNNITTTDDKVLSYYIEFHLIYDDGWLINQQQVAKSKFDLYNYLNSSQIEGKINLDNVQLQLSNADNSIDKIKTISDNFNFKDLPKGDYTLKITKQGYITKTIDFSLEISNIENLGTIELIKKKAVVKGTIPSNATATIIETGANSTSMDFSFELEEGNYTLEIEKEGYVKKVNVSLKAGEVKDLGAINLVTNSVIGNATNELKAGDKSAGYYGTISRSDFLDNEMLDEIRVGDKVTNGEGSYSAYNSNVDWLLFSWQDKKVLIPKKPIEYGMSWHDIKENVIGDIIEDKDGNLYKIKFITGANESQTMWNELIYGVYENESPNWANFSDEDLLTKASYGNGFKSWCLEEGSFFSYRVTRSFDGVHSYYSIHSLTYDDNMGWRPVLELQ